MMLMLTFLKLRMSVPIGLYKFQDGTTYFNVRKVVFEAIAVAPTSPTRFDARLKQKITRQFKEF